MKKAVENNPPAGYVEWHEWAEAQHNAGIKQIQCAKCGLWNAPHEFSTKTRRFMAHELNGNSKQVSPVCIKCEANNAELRGEPIGESLLSAGLGAYHIASAGK